MNLLFIAGNIFIFKHIFQSFQYQMLPHHIFVSWILNHDCPPCCNIINHACAYSS